MSTPYLEVVLKKVQALEGEHRGYYERVVTSIDTVKAFEDKQNVAFMVLAYSLEDLPEPLPVAMPELSFLNHMAAYLRKNQLHISKTLFSEEFARNPAKVAHEIAQGFVARIAEDLLEQYGNGTLDLGESQSFSFRWPYYDAEDFPYQDPDDEED